MGVNLSEWFPLHCILKRSLDFLLYIKKETSPVLFTIKYDCYHRSRSVL